MNDIMYTTYILYSLDMIRYGMQISDHKCNEIIIINLQSFYCRVVLDDES